MFYLINTFEGDNDDDEAIKRLLWRFIILGPCN